MPIYKFCKEVLSTFFKIRKYFMNESNYPTAEKQNLLKCISHNRIDIKVPEAEEGLFITEFYRINIYTYWTKIVNYLIYRTSHGVSDSVAPMGGLRGPP